MPQLLDLQDVTRSFGGFTALEGVTLRLDGGRVGLLGPNGAGKSTLLKILMGLLPPSSGAGTVLGVPLGDAGGEGNWRLRRLIGFMPEADALVPGLTGAEYVALAGELYGMPPRQARRRAHEVLTYLGLEEARYRRVEEYSVGMKQRAKLAQALVHDPPALLLDEPTSGLDPAGRDAMLDLIRQLGEDHGKAVLLSTHLLADVQAVCERVVIVAGGRVRRVGAVAELCDRRDRHVRLGVRGPAEGAAALRGELARRGVEFAPEAPGGEWRLRLPEGWPAGAAFELAAAHGVVVRSLARDDETLEELFLRTVG